MSARCPWCSARSRVTDSRTVDSEHPPAGMTQHAAAILRMRYADEWVARTRQCRRCRRKWNTVEIPASLLPGAI